MQGSNWIFFFLLFLIFFENHFSHCEQFTYCKKCMLQWLFSYMCNTSLEEHIYRVSLAVLFGIKQYQAADQSSVSEWLHYYTNPGGRGAVGTAAPHLKYNATYSSCPSQHSITENCYRVLMINIHPLKHLNQLKFKKKGKFICPLLFVSVSVTSVSTSRLMATPSGQMHPCQYRH